jgi:chemosensory pili system protein ChpC
MADNDSIRCMQLPLLNMQLLLPNSAVAEIIGYSEPVIGEEGSDWYDGRISWRGVMVPVISVEKMCQGQSQNPGPRTRIAVVYNLNGDEDLPYLGIILQDIPRAYLAEPERMIESSLATDCAYLSTQADAMIDNMYIPDMDAIVASLKEKIPH